MAIESRLWTKGILWCVGAPYSTISLRAGFPLRHVCGCLPCIVWVRVFARQTERSWEGIVSDTAVLLQVPVCIPLMACKARAGDV